jgi:hypothetical protein
MTTNEDSPLPLSDERATEAVHLEAPHILPEVLSGVFYIGRGDQFDDDRRLVRS